MRIFRLAIFLFIMLLGNLVIYAATNGAATNGADPDGNSDISPKEFVNGIPTLVTNGDTLLSQEMRQVIGNRKIRPLNSSNNGAANQPPQFNITPDTRTLHVGEKIRVNFAFGDPDDDPYFAGVSAIIPKIEYETERKSPRRLDKEAAIHIDILPSPDPTVVVWDITAQNPGVAVFFISISEIFQDPNSTEFRLISGQLNYMAYAVRVVGDNEDTAAAPTLIDPPTDINLKLKEQRQIVLSANSPDNRALNYNFLYLAFATRLVKGRFFNNNCDLKAIDPGKGIFVVYVTDGNKADIKTFLVTVVDPDDPPATELKLRTLSANGLVNRNKPLMVDLYGENFTEGSRVIMARDNQEQQLATEFISANNLRVQVPSGGASKMFLRVEDGAQVSEAQSFNIFNPVINDLKRIRDEAKNIFRIRILGLGLGNRAKVTANGVALKVVKERLFNSKLIDQVVVELPVKLRSAPVLELRLRNNAGLESAPVNLPLKRKLGIDTQNAIEQE